MKNAFEFVLNFLKDVISDTSTLLTFIGIIISFSTAVGGAICFIDKKIAAHSNKPKNQAKRLLENYNNHILSLLKNESVFFSEDDHRKLLFYKKVPIKKYQSDKKSFLSKLILTSYILLGEAGSGKSSIIKKDYLLHCNKFLNFWRIRTGVVYINQQFLNYQFQDIHELKDLIDCIHRSSYKKINLYIDGIDEFGEDNVEKIFKSIIPISYKIKRVKITSRTNFAVQNIINHNIGKPFGFNENQRFFVEEWNKERLLKFSEFLLKHLKGEKAKLKRIEHIIKSDSEEWHQYIKSPLLLKLYLYILSYGEENMSIDVNNSYLFYTQFVTEVISTQRKRQGNYNLAKIQTELDRLSEDIFNSFINGKKYIEHAKNISAILKKRTTGIRYLFTKHFLSIS